MDAVGFTAGRRKMGSPIEAFNGSLRNRPIASCSFDLYVKTLLT
jgi:hypothetical protein